MDKDVRGTEVPASPREQEEVVRSIGYNASPFHKQTRELLTSLGLSPKKTEASTNQIKETLKDIVKVQDLEELTLKRACLMVEEKLDITLSIPQKRFIKTELSKLVKETLNPQIKEEGATALGTLKKQEAKSVSEVKREEEVPSSRKGETKSGIPLLFPKSLIGNTVPFLVELETQSRINFTGDTGAVGRLSIIAADGKRYTNSPEKSKSKQDIANAERYKQGSFIRLDMKGDVYHGLLRDSKVTACYVSVTPEEAKVNAVFNEFIQATFKENVLENMEGEVIKGDIDITKFTYDVEKDVNETTASSKLKDEKAITKPKSKRRKI